METDRKLVHRNQSHIQRIWWVSTRPSAAVLVVCDVTPDISIMRTCHNIMADNRKGGSVYE